MRILDFTVSGQRIEYDPNCDFTGIVSGSRGYLYARFRFSGDWWGCRVAAIFSNGVKEVATPLLGGACEIPSEVLDGKKVYVRLIGQRGKCRIPTNTAFFRQEV